MWLHTRSEQRSISHAGRWGRLSAWLRRCYMPPHHVHTSCVSRHIFPLMSAHFPSTVSFTGFQGGPWGRDAVVCFGRAMCFSGATAVLVSLVHSLLNDLSWAAKDGASGPLPLRGDLDQIPDVLFPGLFAYLVGLFYFVLFFRLIWRTRNTWWVFSGYFFWWVFVSVCVHMCLCIYVHLCASMSIYVHMPEVNSVLFYWPQTPSVLSILGSYLSPELAHMVGQWTPGICLFLPTQYAPPIPDFNKWSVGRMQVFVLECQAFCESVSPGMYSGYANNLVAEVELERQGPKVSPSKGLGCL